MRLNSIAISLLCFFGGFANAKTNIAPFNAIVTHVYDGDSIRVKSYGREIEIRLSSIDAPEFNQSFGINCRQQLKTWIFGKSVKIKPITQDRYQRIVAEVHLEKININRGQVASGCAWAYRRYLIDKSMIGLEQDARRKKIGLWSQPPSAIRPPWIERRK